MISVLPVTPKPRRKGNWGAGMRLSAPSKGPQHDFGASERPKSCRKGNWGG